MDYSDELTAAAETLIRLSHSSPANSYHLLPKYLLPTWGLRSRRSRCSCNPLKIAVAMDEECSDPLSKTRQSPATPLDFGSTLAPSTSGSEEVPSTAEIREKKQRRRAGKRSASSGDVYHKVGTAELLPVVGSSNQVRRRGKKKTVTELQEQERMLAEENEMLRQSVETKRKEMEDLVAENNRLQEEKGSSAQPKVVKPRFILPDLNEMATEI